MPIKLPTTRETIKVIASADACVAKESDYAGYLKTLDESLLKCTEGMAWTPTRFVLRKVLPFALARKVQDAQMGMADNEMQVRTGYILEEVRCSLIGVEDDPSLAVEEKIDFKKDGDGGADKELMAQLNAAGIIMDLWTARQNSTKQPEGVATQKK